MNQYFCLANVGDGLNLSINGGSAFSGLVVDYGGSKTAGLLPLKNHFLLSHFHHDHYNGFFDISRQSLAPKIGYFYYPLMPEIIDEKVNRSDFEKMYLVMEKMMSIGRPIQGTVFDEVRKSFGKQGIEFCYKGKGDHIDLDGDKFEILWPPRELSSFSTRKAIQSAISAFEHAKKEDPILQVIYSKVAESNIREDGTISVDENELRELILRETNGEPQPISEVVQRANDLLRKAANRLSIAFRHGNNLLFLGDLEKEELSLVVNDLYLKGFVNYNVVIAPHHGTHWDGTLSLIKAPICLASVGTKLEKYVDANFQRHYQTFIKTSVWGNVDVEKKLYIK